LEKDTVSIFRADMAMLGIGYLIKGQKKGRLGGNYPIRDEE
jgi:hypothetical protein